MALVIALGDQTVGGDHGLIIRIKAGEAWASDDPVVKAHPELFTKDEGAARRSRPMEQATATPGEKRVVSGPRN